MPSSGIMVHMVKVVNIVRTSMHNPSHIDTDASNTEMESETDS